MEYKSTSEGTNGLEKDFFKLTNNSVFGKTMQNIRNRIDVKLMNERRKAKKNLLQNQISNITQFFCEDLVSINMKQTKLKFDKPVYCGMVILDLLKTLMYDFHNNYIDKKSGKAVYS